MTAKFLCPGRSSLSAGSRKVTLGNRSTRKEAPSSIGSSTWKPSTSVARWKAKLGMNARDAAEGSLCRHTLPEDHREHACWQGKQRADWAMTT